MSTAPPSAGLEISGFHDAECAGYLADLSLWIALADTVGGPIWDLGAGTGRVSLPLAAAGHDVVAVDLEPDLLDELRRRAADQGVPVETVAADLRTLDDAMPPGLTPAAFVLVPMQTVQLLGGPDARRAMFRAIAAIAAPDAELALSIVTEVESFDGREAFPALLPPDVALLGGYRFESTPRAVLQEAVADPIDMHRRRVVRDGEGNILGHPTDVVITLDAVTVADLVAEAATAGWAAGEVVDMSPTEEHAGSTLVVVRRGGGDA